VIHSFSVLSNTQHILTHTAQPASCIVTSDHQLHHSQTLLLSTASRARCNCRTTYARAYRLYVYSIAVITSRLQHTRNKNFSEECTILKSKEKTVYKRCVSFENLHFQDPTVNGARIIPLSKVHMIIVLVFIMERVFQILSLSDSELFLHVILLVCKTFLRFINVWMLNFVSML
jgi:hypothetical protein